MRRSVIGWVVAGVVVVAAAAFAYVLLFAGGSGEPSTELTTPEVIGSTTTIDSSGGSGTTNDVGSESGQYVIDPAQSTASFEIDEVLRGEPQTVVGTTSEVAGQIAVDPEDLGASQFSPIVINARTLSTDSEQRNRAIRSPVILDSGSDENELITFTPTSIEGLDGSVASVGESYDFQVSGDLLIKGTTNNITFDVSVEMVDETTIRGTATVEVSRSDFAIGIPNVPFVADVADEVGLSLEFVAVSG
jgi:polyisoprenoid-binding protein YceI